MAEAIHIISISGNIGSGKTTLIKNISLVIERDHPDWISKTRDGLEPLVTIIDEDISDWSTLLEHFYADPSGFAFDMQLKVASHYHNIYQRALELSKSTMVDHMKRIIIVERSPFDALYIFTKANKHHMTRREYRSMRMLLSTIIRKDLWSRHCSMVFLRKDVDECWRRKNIRARVEEDNMSMDYMRLLDGYYDDMIEMIEKDSKVKKVVIMEDNGCEEVRRIIQWIGDGEGRVLDVDG